MDYSIYPSVYVSFETIAAQDLCGPVGSVIDGITTVAFDQLDLSTAKSYWYNTTTQTKTPVWYPFYDYVQPSWQDE